MNSYIDVELSQIKNSKKKSSNILVKLQAYIITSYSDAVVQKGTLNYLLLEILEYSTENVLNKVISQQNVTSWICP